MNKQEIYEYLEQKKIWHEITEHGAVYNMQELSEVELPYPDSDAKNLFVRDDKKQHYYLITVKGDKRVDLKEFWKAHGLRRLSFASEEELSRKMGLIPGAVTPLGTLNDEERAVKVFFDRDFLDGTKIIGIHPNDNTATVWLKTEDLMELVKEHGNELELTEI